MKKKKKLGATKLICFCEGPHLHLIKNGMKIAINKQTKKREIEMLPRVSKFIHIQTKPAVYVMNEATII